MFDSYVYIHSLIFFTDCFSFISIVRTVTYYSTRIVGHLYDNLQTGLTADSLSFGSLFILVARTTYIFVSTDHQGLWDVRMFPRGIFPEGSFPVGSFPEGQFPRRKSPEGKFPRRSVSQKEVSQKDSFPEGQFPRRQFPRR